MNTQQWKAKRQEQQRKRAQNRERNTKALTDAGVSFTMINQGWILCIERNGEVIDFMTGTGTWGIRGKSRDHGWYRGALSLIRYIAVGELPITTEQKGASHE